MRFLLAAIVTISVALVRPPAGLAHADAAAESLLASARSAMGFSNAGDRVLHFHSILSDLQSFQSDRTYPPFFSAFIDGENWLAANTAVLRILSRTVFPGSASRPSTAIYADDRAAEFRNDQPVPLPLSQLRVRDLNAWAVVADWSRASDVRLERHDEVYRDYPRKVLTRTVRGQPQRLLIDGKTGFPVKFEFVEPHYLWGQRRIEYVYSNWKSFGDVRMNTSAFRLADGEVELSVTYSGVALLDRSIAPGLELEPTGPPPEMPEFLQPSTPTVSRVGAQTLLLTNTGYTEAAALVGREIFVFDATQGERRAMLDAEAIEAAFGRGYRVNLVVTDLAWPHIAGVRYWVSRGATVIAHSSARDFLERVVDRKWTLAPDALEQRRRQSPFRFVGINKTQSLGRGEIMLTPIDGIGSEGALVAYVPRDRFLWASDYIQTVARPTAYASEVYAAVTRAGWQPEQAAAQHLRLTPWSQIAALMKVPTIQ